jgi:hypothetical protein
LAVALWTARRQWQTGRRAHVTAWFAKTPEGTGAANRLIVVNTGAAEAREVSVTFTDMTGQPWEPHWAGEDSLPLPLPLLAGGDQLHIPIFIILGGPQYVRVALRWRDQRRGVQKRETTLSVTGIPLGDATARVAVDQALSDLARNLRSS